MFGSDIMSFLSGFNLLQVLYLAAALAGINGILLLLRVKAESLLYFNVFLMFIALIEPSPSDILFISLLMYFVKDKVFNREEFVKGFAGQKAILTLLASYMLINMLSVPNIADYASGIRFLAITIYLIVYCFIIYYYSSDKNYLFIQRAYVLGCTVSSLLGIMGHFGVLSHYLNYDMFRTKALFKDPNIFGPSLIPAIIILIGDIKTRKITGIKFKDESSNKSICYKFVKNRMLVPAILLILNITALVLSFSRGAWASLAAGILLLFVLNIKKISFKKIALWAGILVSAVSVTWFGILNDWWRYFIISRLTLQMYDTDRFKAQAAGITMIFDHLFGYGAGQYESAVRNVLGISFSAHSLYVRVLLENGVIGFLLFIIPVVLSLIKLFKIRKYEEKDAVLKSSVLISILAAIAANSIIVDTLHWRYLWLFLGLSLSLTSRYNLPEKIGLKTAGGIRRFFGRIFASKKRESDISPHWRNEDMKINIIDDIEEFKKYKDDWNRLLSSDYSCTPFTEFDWIINWWKFFGLGNRLFIMMITAGGKIIGFCPFIICREGLQDVIRFAGYPHANYMDFVIDKEYREICMKLTAAYIINLNMLIDLQGIPEDSENMSFLLKYLKGNDIGYIARRFDVFYLKTEKGNFQDFYDNRFNARYRREKGKKESRLRELGNLKYENLDMEQIDDIFELHKKRWKRKLDSSRFAEERENNFYKYLASKDDLDFKICVDALSLNGRIIAFKYGFESRGKYISYRTSHDDDFAIYAPGMIIHKERIKECFEKGMEEYDFGPGYMPYKAEWADRQGGVMRIIFPGRGCIAKLAFLKLSLMTKAILLLKKSSIIVNFKEKKLGSIKYSLSKENFKEIYKRLRTKFMISGFLGLITSIYKRSVGAIYSREQYIVLSKKLQYNSDSQSKLNDEITVTEFNIDDLEELSRIMRISPKPIIDRLYKRDKCFTAKHENRIVYYTWVNFLNIKIESIGYETNLDKKSVYIYDGFTDPEYRSRGISSRSLNYISEYLNERNYNKFWVVVRNTNVPSIKTCKKAGFVQEYTVSGIRFLRNKRNVVEQNTPDPGRKGGVQL
jgi:CelD/BcsL family acetyltransferase involved in cellulose biosynthesis/GNAT superfamily N-acetyltransferase